MAKSSKYSRARIRSRVRRPKHRTGSRGWMMATVAIVIVGTVLVFLAYSDRQSAASGSPKIGQHWHAYIGVDICGTWLANAPQFESDFGLHSHGDGLIHIHPFTSAATGEHATVGRFLEDNQGAGWSASTSSLHLWDNATHDAGKPCTSGPDTKGPAEIRWIVGRQNQPWPTTTRSGSVSDYNPKNGDIIGIYYGPKGMKLEKPPGSDAALTNISDLGGQPATQQQVPAGSTPSTPATTAPATGTTSTP